MKRLAYVIGCMIFSVSCFAADTSPTKVDFTAVITDENDQPIVECVEPVQPIAQPDCKNRKTWTLGLISMRALASPEQGLPPEDSLKRGQLALSVFHAKDAVLTVEDIAVIKKRIAMIYGPLITVRAWRLLDPAVK